MGTELKNILVYFIELIKIMIAAVGIMGFKLRFKWYSILIVLLCTAVILMTAQSPVLNTVSLIPGLLSVLTAAFMLTGKNKLICSLLVYLSISMLDAMTAAMVMLVAEIEARTLYYSTFGHFSVNSFSIVILSIISLIRFRLKKPFYHIKHMRIAYIVTSIVSQICFLLYLSPALMLGFNDYSKPFVVTGLSFSGLFFIISNIFLVETFFSKRQFKSLYENSRKQSENLLDYVDTRIETAMGRQKIYHDMPYHLLSLQSLVRNGDIAELEKYIDSLTGRFIECKQAVSTGNHQLNAIISGCFDKYPNIEVEITGIMPNELSIPHQDFCVILSNLLDNAFKFSVGTVKIEIKASDDMLYVRIVNPVGGKVNYTPGIGLINIAEYVEKNAGKIFYHYNDKNFISDLYLPER